MNVELLHKTTQFDEQVGVSSPGPITVGPDVELTGFGARQNPTLPALVDIDVSDARILVTLIIDQPAANLEVLQFIDVMNNIPPIESGSIDPSTDWAGFTPDRLGVGFESVQLSLSQLSGLRGQKIIINLVPEPAGLGLAAIALAGFLTRRR